MSRIWLALLLALSTGSATAAPVKPTLPCERPVLIFGGSTILAEGVRVPGSNDFVARARMFVRRICGSATNVELIAASGHTIVQDAPAIHNALTDRPGSIALIHYPVTDMEHGVSVEALLDIYRSIKDTCIGTGATCIVGGQQPVNAIPPEIVERQLDLERRASAALGVHYLPLYRYFKSETGKRRLMMPLDSGDGRFINDLGHELLFNLYRRRLLELVGSVPR